MSDITAPPAPPAQAPQQSPQTPPTNEAVISPGPNRPNPVGPQSFPDNGQQKSETARDAVKAAFDRAQNPPPKPTRPARDDRPPPKAAEAKEGHNNPPEETEKFDLKKRPSEQPRGDRGQFAPRQAAVGDNTRQDAKDMNGTQGAGSNPILPDHAPYREPPPRFSEAGKKDWANTSENIRGDVHRMHQEFGKAYQAYRGAAEAFHPIAKYHQMAQQHGTTLERALNNYTSMEMKLRSDPVGGLDVIVNNLNLRTPDGQKIGLRDIAYHVLSQSPEQVKQLQLGNQQTAASQQIGALHQEINGLKQHLQQMHTQQQFNHTRSAVDQFAATHPRIDEQVFGKIVENELRLGFDLDTAYRRAELLNPATHADQTRTASAQTREPTDRSIHGSPDVAPSNGASRRPKEASRTPRDAVLNAMSRLNGGH